MNRFLVVILTICSVYNEGLSQSAPKYVAQPNVEASAPLTDKTVPASGPVSDFVIGSEDVLFINVWHEPDFTVTVKVRSDGKISFPLLDDIHAA